MNNIAFGIIGAVVGTVFGVGIAKLTKGFSIKVVRNKKTEDSSSDDNCVNEEDELDYAAGTMVLMGDNSLKPIEDVVVGDYVISKDGKPYVVTRVLSYEDDESDDTDEGAAPDKGVWKSHYLFKNMDDPVDESTDKTLPVDKSENE